MIFKKSDYPPIKSVRRTKIKELKRLKKLKVGWGATGTAVENTVEVPTIPESKVRV